MKLKFDTVIVSCTRIAYNACGPDEYEVTIEANGETTVITTLVSLFEWENQVCERIYNEWLNNKNLQQ